MSHQGPLPDRDADFGLIETLLWTPEAGYALLPEHLARLAASSAALGFRYDEAEVQAALDAAPSPRKRGEGWAHDAGLRIRLVLSRDGAIETSAVPVEPIPPGTVWRVALAKRRFDSGDPLLRHKTTRRALYEDELAQAVRSCGADEVIFLNERDELCEGARCSLFVPTENALLTPPLSCGLLAGTLRAHLLAQDRAREAVLRLLDLEKGFYLGNSVRGLVRAALIS
ncbi:aminotransferase class IV [Methylocystis parvus]|uniref:Probable branched-chain-amino-acid aminotransferase n=1 Tax=Methylocystis parvus TaxID=134 RepID=A0A6B8M5V5_9HYPH|nr:aminotransferase class IV [Methylocystis parvus]QGM96200.1 aminotransferase class IV [Methylocystis parvus]WBJ99973.1 aminotransferase class IV [Methylocystis parvus OBBP]